MSLIAKMKETKYRLNMRKALQTASIEELQINKEELKRELDRRRTQKTKLLEGAK